MHTARGGLAVARGGFQLHEVRDLLGHANVSQTDTYLSAKIAGLRESMKRFDAARGQTRGKRDDDRATASWPRGEAGNR